MGRLAVPSDSYPPITGAALGVGYGGDENDLNLLLKDHRIGKLLHHALARILCVDGIELRMSGNLRQGCADLREKRFSGFGAPLEIPLEGFVDLMLRLRVDANALHPASRARNGASTSSQE